MVGCQHSWFGNQDNRPYNILLILADDLGAIGLSCYWEEAPATPHLDRLASQGVRFETCYATPVCTPSRVMLLTGQYGFRTGYFSFLRSKYTPDFGTPQRDVGSKLTFADVLKEEGYATALAGKWQLTGNGPDLIRDCGFDEYRIWRGQHHLFETKSEIKSHMARGSQDKGRYWGPEILENGAALSTEPMDYGPDLFTDFLIDFMRRNRKRPFLAYYPMVLPHDPWEPVPDPTAPHGWKPAGYPEHIQYMDQLVGRLVQALDDLELRERTLVIFTGDNGMPKNQLVEPAVRVPLIVSCPGTIPRGEVSRALTDLSDLFPTLADFAQAEVPGDHVVDGVSLGPTLRNPHWPHRQWIFSFLADQRMVRDSQWLLDAEGRLFDCREPAAPFEYPEVTASTDADVQEGRRRLEKLLERLPAPEDAASS